MQCIYMLTHNSVTENLPKLLMSAGTVILSLSNGDNVLFLVQRADFKILQIKVVFTYNVMKNKFTIPKEVYFAFRHFIGYLGRSNL